MSDPPNEHRKVSVSSLLLGLFVLFQLIYLPLSNLIQFVPREMPAQKGDIRKQREGTLTDNRPIQDAINGVGTFVDRYGEISGQVQYWSLFAPEFGRQTVFPVVEFEFVEGNDHFLMRREPDILRVNPNHYFRWPGPPSRLVGYEFLLVVVYWTYSEESLQQRGPEWRDAIRDHVRGEQKAIDAYFRYSLAMLRRSQPHLPEPRAGILNVWIHPSPKPGERERPKAYMMPLARWVPGQGDEKQPVIEAFDPIERKFVAIERE